MNIVILTGAGISAESGLGTFRDKDGLWTKVKLEDVATPEGYARNPALVQDFYNQRRKNCADATPNAAHAALARLEADGRHEVLIVTQNVDDLHERAGSRNLIHMHGELMRALCARCEERQPWRGDINVGDCCASCGAPKMRPDVVWFGEMPYRMDEIWNAIRAADLFVSIGTSGNVYPAAAFAQDADRAGVDTLELNLEPSEGATDFAAARYGPATAIVPVWVDELLAD
ncbi:MAG: NAD-dependent deacylase [Pikeienuella sp.]